MDKDRTSTVTIGGEEYELLLSVFATKQIVKRYGSLEAIADKIYDTENMEQSLDETVWLIVLLANQSIAIYNLRNKDNPKPKLTTEEVELLISPYDMADMKDAIITAMTKGGERYIVSEEDDTDSKNTQDGSGTDGL